MRKICDSKKLLASSCWGELRGPTTFLIRRNKCVIQRVFLTASTCFLKAGSGAGIETQWRWNNAARRSFRFLGLGSLWFLGGGGIGGHCHPSTVTITTRPLQEHFVADIPTTFHVILNDAHKYRMQDSAVDGTPLSRNESWIGTSRLPVSLSSLFLFPSHSKCPGCVDRASLGATTGYMGGCCHGSWTRKQHRKYN